MDTFTLYIDQIHPGHHPKAEAWRRLSALDTSNIHTFRATPFGVALLEEVGYVLTDGNHRVAKLYEIGVGSILCFNRYIDNTDLRPWYGRIADLHKKRIYSFGDFLSQCQSGRFCR
jgi:hypothetical protein